MSQLQAFLNANVNNNISEQVIISDRFKKENGELMKFTIRALNDDEMEEINKTCQKFGKKGKVEFETKKFSRMVAIAGTKDPNFRDAESLKTVGSITPDDYIKKVLLPGEIEHLAEAIHKLSGYQDIDELREEAKN